MECISSLLLNYGIGQSIVIVTARVEVEVGAIVAALTIHQVGVMNGLFRVRSCSLCHFDFVDCAQMPTEADSRKLFNGGRIPRKNPASTVAEEEQGKGDSHSSMDYSASRGRGKSRLRGSGVS